ncbi:hypothetical protein KFE25_009968 [Diacronema lutheri]|uniref:C2H2-type domain-containing protein n=1 Tax=Diacronema lutheri TaxID=2081491 RepID=A0A8J6CCB4_DIALT|nr:hypothetical protein KFE25_009968 [Diacronema lutheri]
MFASPRALHTDASASKGEGGPQPALHVDKSLSSSGTAEAGLCALTSPVDGPALLLAASHRIGEYRRVQAVAASMRSPRTADSYRLVPSKKRRCKAAAAPTANGKAPNQAKVELLRLKHEAAQREALRYASARFECGFAGCGSRLNRASDARTHVRNFHGTWYELRVKSGLPCYKDRGCDAPPPPLPS